MDDLFLIYFVYLCDYYTWINNKHGRPKGSCDCDIVNGNLEYVLFTGNKSHTRTHARTRARTHARAHTHTHIYIIRVFCPMTGPSVKAQETGLKFCRRQVFHRKLRNQGCSFTKDWIYIPEKWRRHIGIFLTLKIPTLSRNRTHDLWLQKQSC